MNTYKEYVKDNTDFLIALALVANQDQPRGTMETIKRHVKEWAKANICPRVPVTTVDYERIEEFIKEYSEEKEDD